MDEFCFLPMPPSSPLPAAAQEGLPLNDDRELYAELTALADVHECPLGNVTFQSLGHRCPSALLTVTQLRPVLMGRGKLAHLEVLMDDTQTQLQKYFALITLYKLNNNN